MTTTSFDLVCTLATMPQSEFEKLISDANTLRDHIDKRTPVELAPVKPKRGPKPGSRRKSKGAPAPVVGNGTPLCDTHGTPMVRYGDSYQCGRCAQEGIRA